MPQQFHFHAERSYCDPFLDRRAPGSFVAQVDEMQNQPRVTLMQILAVQMTIDQSRSAYFEQHRVADCPVHQVCEQLGVIAQP